ncbi:transcription elongation regulator 1-like protein [Triplophysa dalaica]|uniref:transcription elongation regulator 1-like protein n=1 Tax=Triplophysa dalaica TaxID=1582913 RepID=UPI0024E004B8|nr:transcription elongation regulator 1-like protein [Triplophysa dalaica]XP_056626467.1 transcription elongation regulator 1-like protein [Triplophysa dalaica]XP_056626468.1 transcription elongation regulator 1-like protein [Triplophysa dalaica]XP_056626469.1 transcription elongation regulator 1-like protein [Triplophysa dalaica]
MIPVQRVKAQPQLWHMSVDAPPWLWVIPNNSGLCRVAASPPVLISSRPHPVIQAVSGWQMSRDPFLPVMHAAAAEPASMSQFTLPGVQWDLPSRPRLLGFQPSAGVDLLPVFPQVYRTVLPPHYGKRWVEKRAPDYKVYLNNTLALKTSWISPDEMGIFQRVEKPVLRTNQTALSICRPAAASRNIHTLLLTPRRISGCPIAIKRGRSKGIALAAAAMMAMESDVTRGPCVSSAHPLHLLSLSPIKFPLFSAPRAGTRSSWEGLLGPVLPSHFTAVTSLTAPGVTLFTGNWKEQRRADKILELKKTPCTDALVIHPDPNQRTNPEDETFKIDMDEDCSPKDKGPVASTPIPGSPWCVVWTGDDKVFFFNPTMHLSVWEKPVDLKDRGDLNRIIEDPPHKRKKDSLDDDSPFADDDDTDEDCGSKSKRNKLEHTLECDELSGDKSEQKGFSLSSDQMSLPLELRIGHFRDMLLERGVSAFSTWEKELHKIVFDPRYLLLSPEERKQMFDQFVKARMNEEYKEKKCKLQQAKEEYRKLLEESKVTSRSTFKEFLEKYGKDPRFKQVVKRKDQELFFTQFISTLKKRDKENRLRLRKMR